jgi:hypothetical protein
MVTLQRLPRGSAHKGEGGHISINHYGVFPRKEWERIPSLGPFGLRDVEVTPLRKK